MNIVIILLAIIGAVSTLRFLHRTSQFLALHFWTSSSPLQAYKTGHTNRPAYALITGGTSGIGLGIARGLLRQGFGVVIIGGNSFDEVYEVTRMLRETYGLPEGRVLGFFYEIHRFEYETILQHVEAVRHLPITILVNSAGGIPSGTRIFQPFSTITMKEVTPILTLNAGFMLTLTHAMLPRLKKQPRSLILNVSDVAKIGLPWSVTYSATKSLVHTLSTALSRELQDDPALAHIDCLAVVPGEVRMPENNTAPEHAPTVEEYGSALVTKVDKAVKNGWREIRPWWRQDLEIEALERYLPDWAITLWWKRELKRRDMNYAAWDESVHGLKLE